jgi:GNAT superfamily N-acetyltransferase
MSYEPVAPGELAAVVTFLEMRAPPPACAPVASSLRLLRIEPSISEYRRLFRRVGEPWLWFSRLVEPDDRLQAIVSDPQVHVYEVSDDNEGGLGLLELDFREGDACELAFVGLVPELAGKGHGRWLLAEALRLAWAPGISRVHVHTCSLDHPAALAAYRRAGFTAYKRAVERFPDPRLTGVLPADCAPQVPLFGTVGSAAPAPAA